MKCVPGDVTDYLTTCSAGRLYDELMTGIGWTTGKDTFKREAWFRYLYGSNKTAQKLDEDGNEPLKRLTDYFSTNYPNVAGYMWHAKQKNYRKLACDMQRAESTLMIDQVGARLATEHPKIPVLTIHDSYLTTAPHVDTVRGIILDEFLKLGITPTLKVESYNHTGVTEDEHQQQRQREDDQREDHDDYRAEGRH
jgi:hypothetical protein